MKRKIYSLLLLLFLANLTYAQFTISYPFETPAGDLVSCSGVSSKLSVKISVNQATSNDTIKLNLPPGVEYVANSIASTSTTGLSVVFSGGTANEPVFIISPVNLVFGNNVTFTIDRIATCDAAYHSDAGFTFKDSVYIIGSAGTVEDVDPELNNYNVASPKLTFVQPSAVNNTLKGTAYSRQFRIINGSEIPLSTVYLSITYPAQGIQLNSLKIGTVDIPLTTPVGDTYIFTLSGTQLGPDSKLTNGEAIVINENFTVKTCGANTQYAIGWGCDSIPANWCKTVTGTGSITMAQGVAIFGEHRNTNLDYVSMCTPWNVRTTFKNTGTGNPKAAAFFDVTLQKGRRYAQYNYLVDLPSVMTLDNASIRNTSTNTNTTIPAARVLRDSQGVYNYNLIDLFTVDPDGPNVGLEDIDGDGFFDDIPAGNTVTMDFRFSINCSAAYSCGTQLVNDNLGGRILYKSMCSSAALASNVMSASGDENMINRRILGSNGYMPANIYPGQTFTVNVGMTYQYLTSSFINNNTRYQYVFTLPTGTSVSNVKWAKGRYLEGTLTTLAASNYTLIGNTLTITSPDRAIGWPEFELIYDCSGSLSSYVISYKIHELIDISIPCTCLSEIGCGTLTSLAHCPRPCSEGPSVTSSKVERADNSLGWTDNTLSTRVNRAAISDYDLSKALYLDEIVISAEAVQHSSFNNLFIELALDKATNGVNKLTPIDTYIEIVRGGSLISSATLTAFDQSGSSATEQKVLWNGASALPTGGLLNNDIIKIKSRYQVATNTGLPTHDVQSGKTLIIFNNDNAGNRKYCDYIVPEMYLVGLISIDGHNAANTDACTPTIMGTFHHLALRFDGAGTDYKSEFRPGAYLSKYELTVPPAYALLSNAYIAETNYNSFSTVYTTIPLTATPSGNTYTYVNPGTWPAYPISVTNYYGALIEPRFQPTCAAGSNTEKVIGKVYVKEFFYHYADPSVTTYDKTFLHEPVPVYTNPPSIKITDETGSVQVYKSVHRWIVKMTNDSKVTAPFTWLAIPTTAGVTINSVKDSLTGINLTPIPYSGGIWYQISNTGLTSGESKYYIIEFTPTTCTNNSVNVLGGWNCTSFPTDPNAYACGIAPLQLKYTTLPSAIEITNTLAPTTSINMCTAADFQYIVNSTRGANTLANKVRLNLPVGLVFVGNFEAEYPLGSGVWQTITDVVSGNSHTFDLTTHAAYPADGLPGTFTDGGDPNKRAIGFRFKLQPSCNFTCGRAFSITNFANRPCGGPAQNNNTRITSAPIRITGVTQPYVTSDVITIGDVNSCGATTTVSVATTISGGTTTLNAQAVIILPIGFSYAGSLSGVTYISDTLYPDGKTVLTLALPNGIGGGQTINYSFNVINDIYSLCGDNIIALVNSEPTTSLMCNGTPCPSSRVETGSLDKTFNLSKPSITINSLSVNPISAGSTSDSISFSANVTNNGLNIAGIADSIRINIYNDANGNGIFDSDTDIYLGLLPVGTLANAATATLTQLFNVPNINNTCSFIAVIDTDSIHATSCVCTGSIVFGSPLQPTPFAGSDESICETADSYTLSSATTNNTLYIIWSSSGTGSFNDTHTLQPIYTPSYADYDNGSVTLKLETKASYGCSVVADSMVLTLNKQPSFSFTYTDLSCFQSGDGEINITGYGGSGSYIYYLLKESTTTPGTYEDFQNSGTAKTGPHTFNSLDFGKYSIKIIDTNGCEQVGCNFSN